MRRLVVKEGPLVFIRNVVLMELAAAVLLYVASFLENYEQLYMRWGPHQFLRYDNFLMLAFSSFQMIYIVLLFLDWYFSYYEIHDNAIIRRSGLLFRHRKLINLSDVASVEIYQSPISRMMHHATIIIEHTTGRITKLKNIPNYEEYFNAIRQSTSLQSNQSYTEDIVSLIKRGEGRFIEFKETVRYDVRKGEVSREIERMILKTIVGFLNAEGGTLLIGVRDSGEIAGLEIDYKNLPKKNRDGLENHLNMLIRTAIGLHFVSYISVRFEHVEDKEVCVIQVAKSHRPAYLQYGTEKNDRNEEFFVRVGNTTQPFSMSQAEEYIKTNWK